MGWKSTLTITRDDALSAIMSQMAKLHMKSNSELESMMRDMFGDDVDLPYYGHNFEVVDHIYEDEEE